MPQYMICIINGTKKVYPSQFDPTPLSHCVTPKDHAVAFLEGYSQQMSIQAFHYNKTLM